MRQILQAALVTLLLVPTGAMAQDFGKGMEAYNSGDYATALEEWTPLAEQGDAPAHTGRGHTKCGY